MADDRPIPHAGAVVGASRPAREPAASAARSPEGERRALAAALITVSLWASAFVGIRAAGDELSPGALSLGRLLTGAVVLGAIVAWRRDAPPPRADAGRLVLCGVLWFGAYNVLLNAGERLVDAGTAAMLVNVGPVLIAVLAGFMLGEGFPPRLLAGCAVAFAGALLIGIATSDSTIDGGLGAALCLAAAAAYAGGVIAQKPLLERSSALQITFLACVIGAAACLPWAPALASEIARSSPGALAWMAYLGVFPTAIGFTTWAYALKRTTAGRMGATTYLVPPLTVGMSALVLSETPAPLALGGGALCLAGVAVARGSAGRRRQGRRVLVEGGESHRPVRARGRRPPSAPDARPPPRRKS